MKIFVVFATIVAVSFGAAIQDISLKDDLQELSAFIPQKEIIELVEYYLKNDAEVKSIMTSQDLIKINQLFVEQPEVKDFIDWISKNYESNQSNENINKLALMINANYKPGWQGFMEAYFAVIPMDKITSFVQEKVAEGGIFAEFWSRLQGLRPAYERVIRLPEFVEAVKRLEALGFDGAQYDALVRDQLGWH